jgi:hypothetical protein
MATTTTLVKNSIYVLQPNQGGRFAGHYKIGLTSNEYHRSGEYSTYYPRALGGFTVIAVLVVAKDMLFKQEKRAHDLAPQHNFIRIDPRAEWFLYVGTDVHADARRLLIEVRGNRFGNITATNAAGHHWTVHGGHLNTGLVNIAHPMQTRGSNRTYITPHGGVRVLRPAKK